MVGQFIAMGMGMGIMPVWEGWSGLRVVGSVRIRMIHGVVLFPLLIAFPVLAGM